MNKRKSGVILTMNIRFNYVIKQRRPLILMAFEKGNAGRSTRQLADKRYAGRITVTLIGVAGIILLLFLMPNMEGFGLAGIIAIIIAMQFIMGWTNSETRRYKKLERRASKGAKAEENIGGLLQQLPDDYAVFHDIESPYGNIDHVILNKKDNIFLLETKSYHGEVIHDGNRLLINNKPPEKDFIHQILNNTFWLRDEIKKQNGSDVFIKPIIVFTNAFVKVYKPVKNISIINKKYLIKTLTETSGYKDASDKSPGVLSLFTVLSRLQKINKDDRN
jgi:hypothetical protein